MSCSLSTEQIELQSRIFVQDIIQMDNYFGCDCKVGLVHHPMEQNLSKLVVTKNFRCHVGSQPSESHSPLK